MRSSIILVLLAFPLIACVTVNNIEDRVANSIPEDANAVLIFSPLSVNAAYDEAYLKLAKAGYTIIQEHKNDGDLFATFTTMPNSIGQGTILVVKALVEPIAEGSSIVLRGNWGLDSQTSASIGAVSTSISGVATTYSQSSVVEPAVWKGVGRPKLAFAELVKISESLTSFEVQFIDTRLDVWEY